MRGLAQDRVHDRRAPGGAQQLLGVAHGARRQRIETARDGLRDLTGRDQAVVRYMRRDAASMEFIEKLASFLRFALPRYVQEGKSYLTVAIGCTGGRHRSVMIAETLKKSLGSVKGVRLRVKHRDS